jgi:hypothetical protein
MIIHLIQTKPILYEFNKDNYKNYVELLDINNYTHEPTERYVKTNCPSLNQTILNTYMPTINNISNNSSNNNSNNNNTNIIIIVVTTISSFFIVVIIFIKYIKYQKNKTKKERKQELFDENFGTRYDELIDF